MPPSLADTSVWVAAAFEQHPAHSRAVARLAGASAAAPMVFCLAVQLNTARLITTRTIQQAYGTGALTNLEAMQVVDAFLALPNILHMGEPPGLVPRWRTLAAVPTASPKVWMDAYLAAFALAAGLRIVTLDADFKQWRKHGLEVELI